MAKSKIKSRIHRWLYGALKRGGRITHDDTRQKMEEMGGYVLTNAAPRTVMRNVIQKLRQEGILVAAVPGKGGRRTYFIAKTAIEYTASAASDGKQVRARIDAQAVKTQYSIHLPEEEIQLAIDALVAESQRTLVSGQQAEMLGVRLRQLVGSAAALPEGGNRAKKAS